MFFQRLSFLHFSALGGCVREGRVTVWNTLKGSGIEKTGGETKTKKRGGGKLGQGMGVLKKGEIEVAKFHVSIYGYSKVMVKIDSPVGLVVSAIARNSNNKKSFVKTFSSEFYKLLEWTEAAF